MEPLQAQLPSAGEIDLRCVARRKVLAAEQYAADRRDVRRDRMSAGKVPLGDEGIDPARILRAVNPELVQRDDVHRHLEAAAQSVLANLVRQHSSNARADEEALRAGSVGERLA